MAVRFITPVETPYESQFVPMPLDFMYKAIQEKQKGLDTTRGDLGSADLKIESAPWDTDLAQQYREKFSGDISSLSSRLEKDKSGYGAVAQQLKSLNREYNTDPEFQRVIKHHAAYTKNVEPWLGKPNSPSLYFKGMMRLNPETQQFEWKKGSEIAIEDIRSPIEDNSEKYITENVLDKLRASLKESYGEGKFVTDPNTGATMWQSPDGTTLENIDMTNPFTKNAIKQFAKRMYEGTNEQDYYAKEFKLRRDEQGNTIGRGYTTLKELEELVGNTVSKGFYRKETIQPGGTKEIDNPNAKRKAEELQAAKDRTYAISSQGATTSDLDLELVSNDITANSTMSAAKLREADKRLFEELNRASTDENYSPTLRSIVYSGADGNITGEGSFGVVLDQMLTEAANGVKDPKQKQQLVELATNPFTANMVITSPETYLGENGYFAKNGMSKEQINAIKNNLYQQLIGISQDPGDQEALDVTKGVLKNYNESKSLQSLAAEKQKVFDKLAEVVMPGADTKQTANLLIIGNTIKTIGKEYGGNALSGEPAFNNEFTQDQLDSDLRLQFLLDKGALKKLQNGKYAFYEISQIVESEKSGSSSTTTRYPGTRDSGGSFQGTPVYKEALRYLNFQEKAIKDNKFSFVKELKTIKETTEGEKAGTLKAVSKEYLELLQNPVQLTNLLQQTAALVGKGGKDYRNKGTAKEVFEESLYKGEDFNGNKFKITDVAFEVNNFGIPMIVLTAMTDESNPNSFSQVSLIYNNEDNPTKYSDIVSELLTDDAPEYRDVGAAWYASAAIDKDQLGLLNLFFDAKEANKQKSVKENKVILFKDKQGNEFGVQTTNTGRVALGKYENGQIIPFTTIRTPSGKLLDPNDVKDYQEALVLLGYGKLEQGRAQQNFGGQGGTSVGKSPIQQGQLWTPK
jgi:hypothetical protein